MLYDFSDAMPSSPSIPNGQYNTPDASGRAVFRGPHPKKACAKTKEDSYPKSKIDRRKVVGALSGSKKPGLKPKTHPTALMLMNKGNGMGFYSKAF